MDVFRTMIAPAEFVVAVRAGCASLGEQGMFIRALVTEGQVTHYISAGHIPERVVTFLEGTGRAVYGVDVSEEEPSVAMDRLQLSFQPDEVQP